MFVCFAIARYKQTVLVHRNILGFNAGMQRKQNSQLLDINKQFVFIRKSWDLMQACNENKTVRKRCKGHERRTSVVLQLRNV